MIDRIDSAFEQWKKITLLAFSRYISAERSTAGAYLVDLIQERKPVILDFLDVFKGKQFPIDELLTFFQNTGREGFPQGHSDCFSDPAYGIPNAGADQLAEAELREPGVPVKRSPPAGPEI